MSATPEYAWRKPCKCERENKRMGASKKKAKPKTYWSTLLVFECNVCKDKEWTPEGVQILCGSCKIWETTEDMVKWSAHHQQWQMKEVELTTQEQL